MNIAIGSDHAGYSMKEDIKDYLTSLNHNFEDFGTDSIASVDYPDFAIKIAEAVASGKFERGILICGSGIGMSIVANKVPGIRASLCYNIYTAWVSRKHNDANILTLGARVISKDQARQIVKVWLETPFEGGRHKRRLNKIKEIEKKYFKCS